MVSVIFDECVDKVGVKHGTSLPCPLFASQGLETLLWHLLEATGTDMSMLLPS